MKGSLKGFLQEFHEGLLLGFLYKGAVIKGSQEADEGSHKGSGKVAILVPERNCKGFKLKKQTTDVHRV